MLSSFKCRRCESRGRRRRIWQEGLQAWKWQALRFWLLSSSTLSMQALRFWSYDADYHSAIISLHSIWKDFYLCIEFEKVFIFVLNLKRFYLCIEFEKVRKKVEQLGDKVEDQKCQVGRKNIWKKKPLLTCNANF